MVDPLVTAQIIGVVFGGGFLLIIFAKSIVIIHPHEKGIVERFGKYDRTLGSGLSFMLPFIEHAYRVDMRETIIDVSSQEVITKDNVAVEVDAIIYFKVTDPFRVMYNVARFEDAVSALCQTSLRNIIGMMELDYVFGSREKINMELRKVLDEVTDRWGARVTRVEIQDIRPPKDIIDAMSRQMKAERNKRASILDAEGVKKAAVLTARGERDAEILRAEGRAKAIALEADAERKKRSLIAEGEAKAIQRVFGAIHQGKPTKDVLTLKYLEALEKMADGQATKIFMPFESSGILSNVAALGDVFGEGLKGKSMLEAAGDKKEAKKQKKEKKHIENTKS